MVWVDIYIREYRRPAEHTYVYARTHTNIHVHTHTRTGPAYFRLNSFFRPYFRRPVSVVVAVMILKAVKTIAQPPPVLVVLVVWLSGRRWGGDLLLRLGLCCCGSPVTIMWTQLPAFLRLIDSAPTTHGKTHPRPQSHKHTHTHGHNKPHLHTLTDEAEKVKELQGLDLLVGYQ